MIWNARVEANITFDFEIEADTEDEVRARIKDKYLEYIGGGEAKGQNLTIRNMQPNDALTNIFVMETDIEDVYELD